MKVIIVLLSFALLAPQAQIFAQQKKTNTEKKSGYLELDKSALGDLPNAKIIPEDENGNVPDYKVISSNSSFIEIEFYPQYKKPTEVKYAGQDFVMLDFENAISKNYNEAGQPDVRKRTFNIILPSEVNNRVTVTDFALNDAPNVNLVPIPTQRYLNTGDKNLDNYELMYLRDSKTYSQNKFYPENIASLENTGQLRDISMCNLVIHPYLFNPVTKQVKQYTRLRIRIDFGQSPVLLNRPRTKQEVDLLSGLGLNSDVALNWMSPKSLRMPQNKLLSNSPFVGGDWYKVEIKDNGAANSEGIYKMSKSFLEAAGLNVSSLDPRTIKMYGNGGYPLSTNMADPRPNDIQEIPIYIEGEGDGHFDAQDYILFYARSIYNWDYDTTNNAYTHFVDVYSLSNYYWICLNTGGPGLRMNQVASENSPNPIVPSSFKEKLFYEPEESNLINEGEVWLSHRVNSGESLNWSLTMTGLEANSDVFYRVKPACRVLNNVYPNPCQSVVTFQIKDDNTNMSEISLSMLCVEAGFNNWIYTDKTSFSVNAALRNPPNSETANLRATFMSSGGDGEGYLDWMEIQYMRRFNSASSDMLRFDAPLQAGVIEYNASTFSSGDIKVFDITEHNNVKRIQPISINGGSVKFQKTQSGTGYPSKFIVAGPNGYKTPTSVTVRVPNQNLHGISDGASFVIITHPDFMAAAERLKQKREGVGAGDPSYLKTSIFTCDQIYNEFSGGVLDAVAIRDFLKYAFDNWQQRPTYVLFLGDGDFDYRNILINDGNWVPAYEVSDPYIHQVNGYTSDDFYTDVVPDAAQRPDIGSGRITARSLQEANQYLDKVDCYEDPSTNEYWKNRMVFVADDGLTSDNNEGSVHTDQCERLAEQFAPNVVDKTKLYLIAYPTVITAQGRRKPGVNADIAKWWNTGCLNVHYTGHGSPDVWAHEYVLEKDVIISQLHNNCLYPFVSIASCDMAKFDNPLSQSAAELFVMAPNKGAIGTLAATRPVYGGANAILMEYFFSYLYKQRDTLLLPIRYGKAIFQTKQSIPSFTNNDMKFLMICDPSLRTALPRFQTKIDSIVGLSNDTMRALSRIKIYGSIIKPDSTLWSDYNGKTYVKVYDVTRHIEIDENWGSIIFAYKFDLPGGIIYSGIATVQNGKWTTEYVVPRDISYLNQRGKLVNYFYNNQADGSGLNTNFFVGGINPSAPLDTTGPIINAFLNDRNFRTGDVVNENFKLIADLFDESGINTTGTIGHKLEATLDGDENHKYDLTNFYNSDTSYKSGSLSYDFTGVAVGKHTLKLRAWDTYNNSSEAMLDFNVIAGGGLQVINVFNYPNPFKGSTAFTFQHNYPGTISAKIKVYTVAGRMIKQIDIPSTNDKFVYVPWDGKDADGETLGNGIYIYKLVVTTEEGTNLSNTGKLAVLK